jgi:hypothetical protein
VKQKSPTLRSIASLNLKANIKLQFCDGENKVNRPGATPQTPLIVAQGVFRGVKGFFDIMEKDVKILVNF